MGGKAMVTFTIRMRRRVEYVQESRLGAFFRKKGVVSALLLINDINVLLLACLRACFEKAVSNSRVHGQEISLPHSLWTMTFCCPTPSVLRAEQVRTADVLPPAKPSAISHQPSATVLEW